MGREALEWLRVSPKPAASRKINKWIISHPIMVESRTRVKICYSNWQAEVELWQLLPPPASSAFYWRRKKLSTSFLSHASSPRVRPSVWLWFHEINGLTTAAFSTPKAEKNPIKLHQCQCKTLRHSLFKIVPIGRSKCNGRHSNS